MNGRNHTNNTIITCSPNISLRTGEYIIFEVVNECDETVFFPAVGYVFAWFKLVTNGLYTTEYLLLPSNTIKLFISCFKLIYIFLCSDVKPGVKYHDVVMIFYYAKTVVALSVTTLDGGI